VQAGVRAVFAFPLHQGAIRIGALVLYRDRVGDLTHDEWLSGVVLADVASQVVLALQAGAPDEQLHELLADEPAHWAEVHQATGMISVQLQASVEEAFVRLRAHAFSARRPLADVARDVVERRLRLES
jgi:ANTAR domain